MGSRPGVDFRLRSPYIQSAQLSLTLANDSAMILDILD